MVTTASSFSTRSNAKRAAERMIGKGTAPELKYAIQGRDRRFEIVWKTAPITTVSTQTVKAQPTQNNWSHAPEKEGEGRASSDPNATEIGAETGSGTHNCAVLSSPTWLAPELTEPSPIKPYLQPERKWLDGVRVMVRKGRSWREATIVSRIDAVYWRAEYLGGGSGMFRETDIRA
jgi:hypothetical protein